MFFFVSNSWWYTGAAGWRPHMLPSTCRTACCLGTFAKSRWTWGSDPTNQASCSFNHSRGGLRHASGTWVVLGHKAMLKSALSTSDLYFKTVKCGGAKGDAPRMGGAATLWCCDAAALLAQCSCHSATLRRCRLSNDAAAATLRLPVRTDAATLLALRRCNAA